MGRGRVVVLTAVALALLAGLYLALRPGGDGVAPEPPPAPTATTAGTAATTAPSPTETVAPEPAPAGPTRIPIRVTAGRPAGGVVRVSVSRDEQVVLVVRADAADVVHLHGYDREAPVGPRAPAQIGFTASVAGKFEVELEQSGVLIAEISVTP